MGFDDTHEFWRSKFLALTDKREATSFWLVVLLFPWNARVPVVGDHEQVFKVARASPLQDFEHLGGVSDWTLYFVGNRCRVQVVC